MKPNCGLLLHVGRNMWSEHHDTVGFSETLFDEIMDLAAQKGVCTVWLDLGEAVEYKSHPELSLPGALTQTEFRALLRRTREKGITPLPKLNFSCAHNDWMGEYQRMVSSRPYYDVCHDLILEVSELFDGPAMFHMGMDEENMQIQGSNPYIVIRGGELKWHDVNFYMDEIRKAGGRPVCWSDLFWDDPEGCQKNISKDMVMMPWYYGAIHPEHYRAITSWDEWVKWYARPEYAGLNIEYVEQDPDWVKMRNTLSALPAAGYDVIPALSNYYGNPYNPQDVMEFCKATVQPGQLLGYVTAPWKMTLPENKDALVDSVLSISAAAEKIYN